MTIGKKLKKQRLSLGLNRKQFADGIINESYLAYVENDKSEIRVNALIALLKQNNISIISFLSNFGDAKPSLSVYEQEADDAFFNQDIVRLKKLSNSCPNTLTKEVIQLMTAKISGNLVDFPNCIRMQIKKTFWEMERWNANFLWIMSNVMEIYTFNDLEGLVNSVFHNFKNFPEYDNEIIKLLASIALNYLQICLLQSEVNEQEVKKSGAYLDKLPTISIIAFEKIKGKYLLSVHYADEQTAAEINKILR